MLFPISLVGIYAKLSKYGICFRVNFIVKHLLHKPSTLPAAEFCAGSFCCKYSPAVFADPQLRILIRQGKTEHHLNAQRKGMKIPYQHRPFMQFNMVCRYGSVKGFHCLTEHIFCAFVKGGFVLIVEICREEYEWRTGTSESYGGEKRLEPLGIHTKDTGGGEDNGDSEGLQGVSHCAYPP